MQFTRHQRIAYRLFALAFLLVMLWTYLSKAHADAFKPTRFTVMVEGTGPDVIMIPGLASSSAVWRPEAEKLKAHYRVHLIQVNGFAGAPAGANASGPILLPLVEELATYVRANNLNHPAFIGHSLGGLLGLILADKHPETVGKLMVVDSLPFFGMFFGPTATVATVEPRAAQMRDQVANGTQEAYAAGEPKVMATLIKSKNAEAQAAVAAAQASDHTVAARAMYEDMTTDLRGQLPKMQTPTVILYPFDAAAGFPQGAVDALYQGAYTAMPNKRLVRIDGSFHFIQIDQPEAFDREVQAFLTH